jgi:hypothetical protein
MKGRRVPSVRIDGVRDHLANLGNRLEATSLQWRGPQEHEHVMGGEPLTALCGRPKGEHDEDTEVCDKNRAAC